MKRVLPLLLLLALAGSAYYFYFLRNTPVSALMQAARATQTHDFATFERFVDVDELTGGVVDDVTSHSALVTSLLPGSGLLLRSGLGLLKPQLTRAAHAEIKRYIETGSLEAAEAASPKRLVNASFLGLAGRIVGPGSSFKGIKSITEKGSDAWVGLEFTQPRSDTTMVVEVQLQRQPDGHWQAKRITNSTDLLQQIVRLEGKRLL